MGRSWSISTPTAPPWSRRAAIRAPSRRSIGSTLPRCTTSRSTSFATRTPPRTSRRRSSCARSPGCVASASRRRRPTAASGRGSSRSRATRFRMSAGAPAATPRPRSICALEVAANDDVPATAARRAELRRRHGGHRRAAGRSPARARAAFRERDVDARDRPGTGPLGGRDARPHPSLAAGCRARDSTAKALPRRSAARRQGGRLMHPDAEEAAIQSDAYIDALLGGHARLPIRLPARGPRAAARCPPRHPDRSSMACRASIPSFLFEERLAAAAARGGRGDRHARRPSRRLVLDRRLLMGGAIASGFSHRRRGHGGVVAKAAHVAEGRVDADQAALRRPARVVPDGPLDALPRLPGDDLQQAARQEPARLSRAAATTSGCALDARLALLLDRDSFRERDAGLESVDMLSFVDQKPYPERLAAAQASHRHPRCSGVGHGHHRRHEGGDLRHGLRLHGRLDGHGRGREGHPCSRARLRRAAAADHRLGVRRRADAGGHAER